MKVKESDRLIFRKIEKSDFEFFRIYLSDPERTRYLPLRKPYPESNVREFLSFRIEHWETHGFGTCILIDKATDHTVGYCGLEHAMKTDFIDIRYGLLQEYWGMGLALEAAKSCVKHGFDFLGLSTIYGAAIPENHASISILKKIGMKPDMSFDCYGSEVLPFSISKSEYESAPV